MGTSTGTSGNAGHGPETGPGEDQGPGQDSGRATGPETATSPQAAAGPEAAAPAGAYRTAEARAGATGARSRRGRQTVRDMVLSMAAVGVVAAVIYFFVPHDPPENPVRTVDYTVELTTARRAAPFEVLAPEGLSKGWRATSVSYDRADREARGAVWHLGFLNPYDEYAAVEQSDGPARPFIEDKSKGARREGTAQVGGVTWDRYEGPKYNALVLEDDGVTTVVTGTAPHRQLAELAAALKG